LTFKTTVKNAPIIPVAPIFTLVCQIFPVRVALNPAPPVNLSKQNVLTKTVNLGKQARFHRLSTKTNRAFSVESKAKGAF
jgi:hypothetical protein